MPLEMLLLLVVGGIASIALILHFAGMSRARQMTDSDEACAHWNATYPDFPAMHAMLSATGEAALIRHAKGHGLVWSMGKDVAARRIAPGMVELQESARHLVLRTTDFTAPRIKLALTADERPVWRAALEEEIT